MKMYVVHNQIAVCLVTTDRQEAEECARLKLSEKDRQETEFRPVPESAGWSTPQERLHFRSSWSGRWNKSLEVISTVEVSAGATEDDSEKGFRERWADRFEAECGDHGRANGPGLIMAARLMCPERSGWGAEE